MTIQEIRVGNYVMHSGGSWLLKVMEVRMYGLRCAYDSGLGERVSLVAIEDCQPVPLSPDILEAVGQRFRDGFLLTGPDSAKPSVFLLVYDDTQFKVFINWNYIGIIPIRSFHQLQNIIHSLTGTELEYKEPVKG